METPTCPSCRTDKYLRYLHFQPGYSHVLDLGVTQRNQWQGPETQFYCRKCNYFNGHTVPDGWEPPNETITDQEILAEVGHVYANQGQKTTRQPNGTPMRTYGS